MKFDAEANFYMSKFKKDSYFVGVTIKERASFSYTEFGERAYFSDSEFHGKAVFLNSKFASGGEFINARFAGKADFSGANFRKRTLFASRPMQVPIFSGAELDFRAANFEPPDALVFRDANLTKCRFLGTDLRKAEIVGDIEWSKIGNRIAVYDEIAPRREDEKREWHHIERLYRELKQNYEDRRDYERAGDFHYGEKEMRRLNPKTSWGLWFWLTLYKWAGGYGERWLRPLVWATILLIICVPAYLWSGLWSSESKIMLDWSSWGDAVRFSFQTMTLLKPADVVAIGSLAKWTHALQSIFGPILIGLFALALRQRLKR